MCQTARTRRRQDTPLPRPSELNRLEMRLTAGLYSALADVTDDARLGLNSCCRGAEPARFAEPHARHPAHVPSAVRTAGDFLRHLAELADRIDCASGEYPVDDGGATAFEDTFGTTIPAKELYPHLRIEAGPSCCPFCAADRVGVIDGGRPLWMCEACGNDAAEAKRVLRRRERRRAGRPKEAKRKALDPHAVLALG